MKAKEEVEFYKKELDRLFSRERNLLDAIAEKDKEIEEWNKFKKSFKIKDKQMVQTIFTGTALENAFKKGYDKSDKEWQEITGCNSFAQAKKMLKKLHNLTNDIAKALSKSVFIEHLTEKQQKELFNIVIQLQKK